MHYKSSAVPLAHLSVRSVHGIQGPLSAPSPGRKGPPRSNQPPSPGQNPRLEERPLRGDLALSTSRHARRKQKTDKQHPHSHGISPSTLKRVAHLVDQGRHSQAAALLCSRGIAERSVETHEKVGKLFPAAPAHQPASAAFAPTPHVEIETSRLRQELLSTPKGLAPGPSGLRVEHLRTVLEDRKPTVEAELLEALTLLTNLAVSGRLPLPLQPFLCGGRLVPVLKKDNGIRPIVVGELLRSLIAKVALAELGDGLADLQPLQVGVGGQGPWAQAAVLTVREWTKALRGGSPNVLVKVDIANAFNSINRSACLQGIRSLAPGLSCGASPNRRTYAGTA